MSYFEDESKLKFYHFKHLQEKQLDSRDQIIKLEGLVNDVEEDVTARTYEKLKREMIAKIEKVHVEDDIFAGKNLEGPN